MPETTVLQQLTPKQQEELFQKMCGERRAALASDDEVTIRDYLERWDGNRGNPNYLEFWKFVYEGIVNIHAQTGEFESRTVNRAKDWLIKRGYPVAGEPPPRQSKVAFGVCPKCYINMHPNKQDGFSCPSCKRNYPGPE